MTKKSPNLRPRELGARQHQLRHGPTPPCFGALRGGDALRRPAGSPAIMVAELDRYRADVDSLHGAALSPPTWLDALPKYE